jgi:hypothetical protein
MSTALIDALQANLGPHPLNGPAILAKLIDEVELKGQMKSQLATLLERWDQYWLTVSPAAAASYTAWMAQCSVRVGTGNLVQGGAIRTNPTTADFWKSLQAADSLLENAGAVRQWGEAAPTTSYRYIAKKFETDHLVADKKAGKAHAIARMGANANVPASTSIETVYAKPLSEFVQQLNDAGVFAAVELYLNTVKGWSAEAAKVDSVAWLTRSPVTAWTFKRKGASVDEGTKASGRLMFAVQADENAASVRLLYHFTSVESDPDSIQRAAPGAAWERVELQSVLAKVKKFDAEQIRTLTAAWPHVYLSA